MSDICKIVGITAKMLCAVFAVVILFCGCGRGGSTELRWQSYPLTVKCAISCDDRGEALRSAEAVIEVTAPHMGDIVFLAPESLCGYTFSLKEDGAYASYDGFTIPLGEDMTSDLEALFSLFSLDPEYMSEHSVSKQNGTTVNVAVFSLYRNINSVDGDMADSEDGNKADTDEDGIGTATVYISAAGDPIRIEAEYSGGERLVINMHECEYSTE